MDRLIRQLEKRRDITDWRIIRQGHTSYQMYVIGNVVDTVRKVTTNTYAVTVYCDHDGFRGSTNLTLFEHELGNIRKRLDQAVFIARRINHQPYQLPSLNSFPFVETFDPTLLQDIQEILSLQMADRLIDAVEREPYIRLSSSEYFLDLKEISMRNSRGLDLSYRTSEIFFDGVLLAWQHNDDVDVEMHFEPRARRLQELSIETIVARYAGFARDRLKATLPRSGHYPVILSGDALTGIFSPLVHHTAASTIFQGTSRFIKGKSLLGRKRIKGEPLTLISNGFVPFGLRTFPADVDGVPASRFALVRNGIFERPWSTKQYADYLQTEPTGSIANLEIPIDPSSMKALLHDDGPVLHVVAFSALMPDPVSGNFAAEIKLGYEIKNGSIKPVSGGSVSGNLITCFADAHFSTEAVQSFYALSLDSFGGYCGPQAIRFHTFQISGDN